MVGLDSIVMAQMKKLREQYVKDDIFNRFLYGGIHDLDPPIGPLVYVLWKGKVAVTTWSCSGHVGTHLIDQGSAVLPDHFVYQPGMLFFNEGSDAAYTEFHEELNRVKGKYSFAKMQSNSNGVNAIPFF